MKMPGYELQQPAVGPLLYLWDDHFKILFKKNVLYKMIQNYPKDLLNSETAIVLIYFLLFVKILRGELKKKAKIVIILKIK